MVTTIDTRYVNFVTISIEFSRKEFCVILSEEYVTLRYSSRLTVRVTTKPTLVVEKSTQ